ncbi:MAG: hypothetical protein NVSMB51_06290 [Solirubrobacteraceae bacterium]
MAAATGATGARAWLQARHFTWLTPRRMHRATVALLLAGALVPTIALEGSSKPPRHAGGAPQPASTR